MGIREASKAELERQLRRMRHEQQRIDTGNATDFLEGPGDEDDDGDPEPDPFDEVNDALDEREEW